MKLFPSKCFFRSTVVNRIMRGDSHDNGLFANKWDSIPIYLKKTYIRECPSWSVV